MVKKGSLSQERLLTNTELELMNIIWELGEGTVNDVLEKLSSHRDLAYTSVSTILRILEKKKILKSRKDGKCHIYVPKINKSTYENRSLNHLLSNVFSNAPTSMVRALVNSQDLSHDELREIKKIVTERIKR